jgi:Chromatin remodeling protein, contains PhD zinc finger
MEIPDDVEPEDNVYSGEDLERYCFCRKNDKSGGHYVLCATETCKIKWYHLNCVKMKKIPKGIWNCPRYQSLDHWCICGRKGIRTVMI